jgi:heterodisulfide reductase subunit A
MDVYVLYRDMRTYGFYEEIYREAANSGVKFIRYEPEDKPHVEAASIDGRNSLRITVSDPILEKKLVFDADIVALATAIVPAPDNEEISRLFKAPLSRDGFFLEAHMKLRPVDFATEGVFVCGSAHFPKTARESIVQAQAAAARASTILAKESIVSSGAVCGVDTAVCNGCGLCRQACQFAAIELLETPDGQKSAVTPAACQGCGACNSVCPTGAVSQQHFTDAQILAEIDSAGPAPDKRRTFEPRILAFLCNWCGYAGADMAGVSRIQYPPAAREIRVMCSSRVDQKFIAQAFLQGIDGVLVCGCHLGDCHYIRANECTEKTMAMVQKRLQELRIEPERLRHEYISAAEGAKYAEKIDGFTAVLSTLGSLELDEEQRKGLIKLKAVPIE